MATNSHFMSMDGEGDALSKLDGRDSFSQWVNNTHSSVFSEDKNL